MYKKTELKGGLVHWSEWLEIEADPNLHFKESKSLHSGAIGWFIKRLFCERYAVIKPIGPKHAKFRLGFCSKNHVMKLSPTIQSVNDGIFAVRMWAAPNYFFVVSDHKVEINYYSMIIEDTPVAAKYPNLIVY